ncbi:hypothetical protein TcCL_NonESM11545 [Trypanosoma cruzi]|nr:hypothetical protein TcCL_NonESM11545 [Trypanosoma cruzi]
MRKANEVAREMWAPSTWEQRMPPAGRFTTFKPHARTAEQRGELCSLFDGNRGGAIDPTAARQDAAVHVSNVCDPAEYDGFGATKIAARSETKQARPLTEEGMDQVIRSRTDWKESVVLRLVWITASRLFEIASLTPNSFTLEPDGTVILDRSVAPKTAGRIPTAPRGLPEYEGRVPSTL